MGRTPAEAFADAYARIGPDSSDLMRGDVDAAVLEAFKDVKAAAHPDRIVQMETPDFAGRGLLAHALFLDWRNRREAECLLDAARQHMMAQLRENRVPHPDVYRLAEALSRLCDAWKHSPGAE
jgi:hypothetical protein